ncbi:pentapeptide repeat-containing protein [Scytonema sp. NUACC26]|uniref:pentapeptide repeat-containing protein n=1 Tax=Scytonema sp. NUACC26 TaxID=3140176 RepID=UPI0034DBFC19
MKVKRQRITVEELLRRYAAGERDFTYIVIDDSREGLFRGIDLSDINLEGSSIGVDFSGAILRKANFRYTVWGDHCRWQEADFSGSNFTGINNESSCVFVRCNFSNTIWEQADLWQSTFEDCDLTDANFDNASLVEVDLYG